MILKSMKEFVLYLRGMTTSELNTNFPLAFHNPIWTGDATQSVKQFLANDAILWKFTGEYAKFLCPKLEKWMFVPCDEDGKVLINPTKYDELDDDEHITSHIAQSLGEEKFKEEQSKCLFEGIEINFVNSTDHEHVPYDFYGVTCNGQWCGGWDNWVSTYLGGNDTVEGLVKLKEGLRPTISETGKKKIGLWV